MVVQNASALFKSLSGVFCLYKPAHLSYRAVKQILLGNICRELNKLPRFKQDKIVKILGATNEEMSIEIDTNYADNPLVSGPYYQQEDFNCKISPYLEKDTSGVFVFGLGEGVRLVTQHHYNQLIRVYKIHGVLGMATDTHYKNGKVIERASYKKITRTIMDNTLSHIESIHQRKIFELLGIDIQTQTAYELAKLGPIRPADKKIPVLYSIKCTNFEPPHFIIEVKSINEYEKYFHTLIYDIGVQLRSTAHCSAVQCIRYGKFTLEHALLKKYWNIENILKSIEESEILLERNPDVFRPSPTLF